MMGAMPKTLYFPELAKRVRSQRRGLPSLYGDVDFSARPYRLALDPDDESSLPGWVADRAELLDDERTIELMSTATMLGDVVADAYAALMEQQSFKSLIDMLQVACREGIDAVPGAPPELERFIAAMERQPDWLDMELVHEGARHERIPQALVAPFVIRGAFMATFLNTYAALPMALTGALGGRRAARRVNETASFFAVTTMPGALDRYGRGFEAAAMVRLMHSMVRYNALTKSGRWDFDVYGIPIPQVDQMPAGLISVYLLARRVQANGRSEFNARERAIVEFARYRCFLLGLPEELLPTTPAEIIHVMHARAATLRDDFDDEICGELVRATMSSYLKPTRSLPDRLADAIEKSYSKFFFNRTFANGDGAAFAALGVAMGPEDHALVALFAPLVFGSFLTARTTSRLPIVGALTDRVVTEVLKQRLASYGKPEFTTDSSKYTPVAKARPATTWRRVRRAVPRAGRSTGLPPKRIRTDLRGFARRTARKRQSPRTGTSARPARSRPRHPTGRFMPSGKSTLPGTTRPCTVARSRASCGAPMRRTGRSAEL